MYSTITERLTRMQNNRILLILLFGEIWDAGRFLPKVRDLTRKNGQQGTERIKIGHAIRDIIVYIIWDYQVMISIDKLLL